MKGFLALFLIGLWARESLAQGRLRLILPTTTELGAYSPKAGELAFDDTAEKVVFRFNDQWNVVGAGVLTSERLPAFKKGTGEVIIYPGSVLINGAFYKNTASITCSYSTSGIGGYDTTSPSTPMHTYLYLVPEPSKKSSNFSCILGASGSGPSSVSVPNRFIGSFWSGADFTAQAGKVSYISSSPKKLVTTGTYSTCTKVDMSSYPSNLLSMSLTLECWGNGQMSNAFGLYYDSGCFSLIANCSNTDNDMAGTVTLSKSDDFYVYIQGTVAGSHYLRQDFTHEELALFE